MTWTALHDACQRHDTTLAMSCLTQQPHDAAQTDHCGFTPLHLLCLNAGAVNVENNQDNHDDNINDKMLPLFQQLVQAYPPAVVQRDVSGHTPLHHVVSQHSPQTLAMVKVLVEADPRVLTIANSQGYGPLHLACRVVPHNYPVVSYLVQQHPAALLHRVKMGEPVVARKNKPRNHTSCPSLVQESPHGMDHHHQETRDALEWRLQQHEDLPRNGNYPLHIVLSSCGNDNNDNNNDTLEFRNMIQLLVSTAPEVLERRNKYGQTPWDVAQQNHHSQIILDSLLPPPSNPRDTLSTSTTSMSTLGARNQLTTIG